MCFMCFALLAFFFFFVSKIDVLHARSWRGVGNVFNKILLIYQKKKKISIIIFKQAE
jgi:hypothetical protein